MQIENQILYSYLKLDYPNGILKYEDQTNKTINLIANNFIEKYKQDFSNKTVVLMYTDDIIGLIAYTILKNINGIIDFKFCCYGKHKITKKSVQKKDFVNWFKFKRLKQENTIFVSCFNPIYKVKNMPLPFNELSFKEHYNIVETFTPKQVEIMRDFYDIDKNLYDNFNDIYFKEFQHFINNYGETNLCYLFTNSYFKDIINNVRDSAIFYFVKLNGNESDFEVFDEIVHSDDKCLFFVDDINEEKKDFLINNLNVFIRPHNIINENNLNNNELMNKLIDYGVKFQLLGNWSEMEQVYLYKRGENKK